MWFFTNLNSLQIFSVRNIEDVDLAVITYPVYKIGELATISITVKGGVYSAASA